MKYFLYGLHRSGTNVLERSIGSNFPGFPSQSNHTNFNKTWKHSFVGSECMPDEDVSIIIYKNLYTWLESVLIRAPFDGHHIYMSTEKQIPEFYKKIQSIQSKHYFVNYIVTLEGMINIYFEFLKMHKQQIDLGKKVHFVSYEDLLHPESYEGIMKSLSKVFGIDHTPKIQPIPSKVSLSPQYNKDSQNYYIAGNTRFFPQDIIDVITNEKDDSMLDELNSIKLK